MIKITDIDLNVPTICYFSYIISIRWRVTVMDLKHILLTLTNIPLSLSYLRYKKVSSYRRLNEDETDVKKFIKASEYKEKYWLSMYKYLDKHYSYIFNKKYPTSYNTVSNRKNVYVLWLQGEDKLPLVSQICLERLKLLNPDINVIILTFENLKEHNINIPNYIIEKYSKGLISATSLSDLIRLNLLANNQGLYLDSTVYCLSPLPDWYFKVPFFSLNSRNLFETVGNIIRFDNYEFGEVYALGGTSPLIYSMAKDIYFDYLKNHDVVLCYELTYYIFRFLYYKYKPVREIINQLPSNNKHAECLANYFSDGDLEKKTTLQFDKDDVFIKLSNKWEYSTKYDKATLRCLLEDLVRKHS